VQRPSYAWKIGPASPDSRVSMRFLLPSSVITCANATLTAPSLPFRARSPADR
jgi:hypothetical protein